MAYASEAEYNRDKQKWRSHRMRARSPAGYQAFLMRQQAYLQSRKTANRNKQAAPTPTPTPAPTPAPTPTPTYTPTPARTPTPPPQPTFDTSAYDAAINNLNMQISSLTSGFQNTINQMNQSMAQERADSQKAMQEMQGQFAQQLAAGGSRERVEGIRTPDRGTGGSDTSQLQRKGVRGTFGRSGDRLMKIQSLNV